MFRFENFNVPSYYPIKTAKVSSILKIGFKRSNLLGNLTGFQKH